MTSFAALEVTIGQKRVTYDLERQMDGGDATENIRVRRRDH